MFAKQGTKRLIIVSTNVAETSITLEGLRYVIDCGYEKNKYIDSNSGMETYKIERITQSSAEQRAGRAGRTSTGYCYRLYSPAVFARMDKHREPDIYR